MRAIAVVVWVAALSGCADPVDQGFGAYRVGRCDMAVQYWLPEANAGNAVAQHDMGVVFEQGCGVAKNLITAEAWYLAAARGGYAPSMVAVGKIQRMRGEEAAGLAWIELAARWGNQDAQQALASSGRPVPPPDLLASQQALSDEAKARLGYELGKQAGKAIGKAIDPKR